MFKNLHERKALAVYSVPSRQLIIVDLPPDQGPMNTISGLLKISGSPKCRLLSSLYLYIFSNSLIDVSQTFLRSLRVVSVTLKLKSLKLCWLKSLKLCWLKSLKLCQLKSLKICWLKSLKLCWLKSLKLCWLNSLKLCWLKFLKLCWLKSLKLCWLKSLKLCWLKSLKKKVVKPEMVLRMRYLFNGIRYYMVILVYSVEQGRTDSPWGKGGGWGGGGGGWVGVWVFFQFI